MRADRIWGLLIPLVLVFIFLGASVHDGVQTVWAANQPAQDEFVPMETVPPEDQLPAAPLLVSAYALLWIAVVVYLWSIWRRMVTVERELSELSRRVGD